MADHFAVLDVGSNAIRSQIAAVDHPHQALDQLRPHVAASYAHGLAVWTCPEHAWPASHSNLEVTIDGPTRVTVGAAATFTATHTGTYGDVITNTAYFSGAAHTGSDDATFFVTPIYTLTISTVGNGSGVVTPTVGAHQFISGTVIILEAAPNPGSTFTAWSGDIDCADSSVTMDGDKFCTATFITNLTYWPVVFK